MNEKFCCGDGLFFGQGEWEFNSDVSKVFQSHAVKSIPGYKEVHGLVLDICRVLDTTGKETVEILDIGCSLGELEKTILSQWGDSRVHITAVDSSRSMIDNIICYDERAVFLCDTADNVLSKGKKYDVIICLYTCQFMSSGDIENFHVKVRSCLNDGGVFILADKFEADDADVDSVREMRLYDFKMDSGYSIEEIVGKKKALIGVQRRLKESYLSDISNLFSSYKLLDVSLNFICAVFYA